MTITLCHAKSTKKLNLLKNFFNPPFLASYGTFCGKWLVGFSCFGARGKNWEDWFEGWHKSGGKVARRCISIKDCTFGRKYGIFRPELSRSAPGGWKCGFLRDMSINNTG
jgi:hypothetical protein